MLNMHIQAIPVFPSHILPSYFRDLYTLIARSSTRPRSSCMRRTVARPTWLVRTSYWSFLANNQFIAFSKKPRESFSGAVDTSTRCAESKTTSYLRAAACLMHVRTVCGSSKVRHLGNAGLMLTSLDD
jgi:hypothetical protein